MNKQEIRERFYELTPDADETRNALVADVNDWIKEGNSEFVMATRCLVAEYTITTTEDIRYYDLTDSEPLFLDVDNNSGGVWYDDRSLTQTDLSELSNADRRWRAHLDGTVTKWWTRMAILWLNKNPEGSKELIVSIVKKADPLIQDSQTPFDAVGFLEPYHMALVKYAQMRFKGSQGKTEEMAISKGEYGEYIEACRSRLTTGRSGSASLEPDAGIYQPSARG